MLILLVTFVVTFFVDYVYFPYNAILPGKESGNQETNGVWLQYLWYFGKHSDDETRQLAQDLRENQITSAYFHVRYIGKSGKLRYRFPIQARRLNAILARENPGLKRIAWIYIGNTRGIGSIQNLSSPQLRHKMVAEARFLVEECGFDGVQWDYEICPDGDTGLLALLEETRKALPQGAFLSVATSLWLPNPVPYTGYGWNESYFQAIAKRTNQICVMGYDSGLYLPRAYTALVEQQLIHVCHAVATSGVACQVIIGVPTYAKGGLSHHAPAENLDMAIRGVRAGIGKLTTKERQVFGGIAPFAEYTTQPEEWETYRTQWLQRE